MYYVTHDKPDCISYETLDRCMDLCWDYFDLPDIRVEISFCDDMEDDIYGYGDVIGGIGIIEIFSELDEDEIIETLIHEIVHLKQILRYELIMRGNVDTGMWYGTRYTISEHNYNELPWEVEAIKYEKILMEMMNMTNTSDLCVDSEADTDVKRYISKEGGSGILWFIETSYNYANPRGFVEHCSFLYKIPSKIRKFKQIMKCAAIVNDTEELT